MKKNTYFFLEINSLTFNTYGFHIFEIVSLYVNCMITSISNWFKVAGAFNTVVFSYKTLVTCHFVWCCVMTWKKCCPVTICFSKIIIFLMLCVMKKLSWVLETSFIIPYILNTCSMSCLCLDRTNKKKIFIYTRPSTVFCSGKPTWPAGVDFIRWIVKRIDQGEKVIRIS